MIFNSTVVVQPRKSLCRAPHSLNKIRTLLFCRGPCSQRWCVLPHFRPLAEVHSPLLPATRDSFNRDWGSWTLYIELVFPNVTFVTLTLYRSLLSCLHALDLFHTAPSALSAVTDSVINNHGGRQHHIRLPSRQCKYASSDCSIRNWQHAFPGAQWRQWVDCRSYNLSNACRV